MSQYVFLHPQTSYKLPRDFDFEDYIETEQELWALFPETAGKRVNFFQVGLTAQIYVESLETGRELESDETYVFMPCPGRMMRPVRMRAARRLTLVEYRMAHLTAVKMIDKLAAAGEAMQEIGRTILGPEILGEVQARMRDPM
jgi:hypothetical protein